MYHAEKEILRHSETVHFRAKQVYMRAKSIKDCHLML